jgi:hypothetical protein
MKAELRPWPQCKKQDKREMLETVQLVAPTESRQYGGLAIRGAAIFSRFADCQSAIRQAASLRYGSGSEIYCG